MSTTISHASFSYVFPNGSQVRPDKLQSSLNNTNIQPRQKQSQWPPDVPEESGRKQDQHFYDGETWSSSGVKMDVPAPADGSLSSTVEEPPPEAGALRSSIRPSNPIANNKSDRRERRRLPTSSGHGAFALILFIV